MTARDYDPGELVQLLTPDGERVEHPDYAFRLDDDALLGFHRDLVLTRRYDAEANALQRHGELAIWPSMLGQEGAQIGAGRAVRPHDFVFPSYREHGVAWCRGLDLMDMIRLFRGADHGGWDPHQHNFGLYTIVVGAQPLHATGYAMGLQRDGRVGTGDPDRDTAVLVFFGDGACSQGDVNEAFVWASVFGAPVVFFVQNNQWAISEPFERQSRVPLYQRAAGFGFPGVRVDGNDALACHAVIEGAMDHARSGNGPMLVEAYTYRMAPHTTTDDPTKYREQSEVDAWKRKDPIARLETYLRSAGLFDDEAAAELSAEADRLGERVRETTRALPDPSPVGSFDMVFSEPEPQLAAQRDWYAEYLDSFLDSSEQSPQEVAAR